MSTAQERNADYWVQRFTEIEDRDYKLSSAYYDRLKRVFKRAEKETKQKLSEWYSRLADNNNITYADAFKLLAADELEEFHWTVQEYIEKGIGVEGNPDWAKQLENASAKVHISRLEEIQTEMRGTVEALYAEYEEGMESLLRGIANDSYYRTAYEVAKGTGIGVTLHRLDTRTLERFLTSPWGKDESNFSERIWNRRDKLINTLNDELAQNLILGLDPQKSIDKIAQEFGVDQRAAGRLVMTESAAIGSMAREASLKELGVEEFEVVATLDSHTSDICQAMDGKHFPMSKFEVGVNAPPFHPNCRSTTVPYFDDEFTVDETRAAREGNDEGYERVPSDMTYKEWKEQYIKNTDTSLSNTGYSDIIGVKKSAGDDNSGDGSNVVDESRYGEIRSQIKRLKNENVAYLEVQPLDHELSEKEIIGKVNGADTKGRCQPLALAYAANKVGLDVKDFRKDRSIEFFAKNSMILSIANIADGEVVKGHNDYEAVKSLLKKVKSGKEYILATGGHTAIVRKAKRGYEYLNLQSGNRLADDFFKISDDVLKNRFKCAVKHKYLECTVLIDVDNLRGNELFKELLGFLNTQG